MSRAGAVFLLEIGTEEIPARMIPGALRDLARGLVAELEAGRLLPEAGFTLEGNVRVYGTPRRLAVRAEGLRTSQPDREELVTGPPAKNAYDAAGRPTKAAEGFARAQAARLEDLQRVATPKGECVAVLKKVRGLAAAEVLARRVPPLLAGLAFPKTMRWGSGEHRFVRPIHSVLALLDEQPVDLTIAGVRSGRDTFGHRFAGAPRIPLRHPDEYLDLLGRNGVLADVDERRRAIEKQLEREARGAGGRIAPPPGAGAGEAGDPDLLEEVTHLVEWPTVIAGEFDAAYLSLPTEILVTAMRHHQRYFSLIAPGGRLLNRFLAVINGPADTTGAIRRGNEWVLRARLADARFFWEEDRKTPLAPLAPRLERVTFHERLGSYARKVERMVRLAEVVGGAFEGARRKPDRRALLEAVRLSKVDLTTRMVKEFPELEGLVGGLYARADGLPAAVADAIYGHYLPRAPEDPLPATPEGAVLSLVDRLDTQAGIFRLGIVPTGSRDPYGLRRSVHGACRILIETGVHVSLTDLIERALDGYEGEHAPADGAPRAQARAALLEFYRARLQHLGEGAGLRQDSVRAALQASIDDPCDARLRMQALDAIRSEAGFESLARAHKRIKNIVRDQPAGAFDARRLRDAAEKELHRALEASRPAIEAAVSRHEPLEALRQIARLRPALDAFFEEVMVLAEDRSLRDNRLALLQSIAALFLRVGDFSEIVVEGEPAGTAARRNPA
jgi:glycyl-tRNA synthetase beta chain